MVIYLLFTLFMYRDSGKRVYIKYRRKLNVPVISSRFSPRIKSSYSKVEEQKNKLVTSHGT